MNQREHEENTCNQRKGRENACDQVANGVYLASDWLDRRRELFNHSQSVVKESSTTEPKHRGKRGRLSILVSKHA